jgi:hypothetical protein
MALPAEFPANQVEFDIGVEDLLLVPLVALAVAVRLIGKACISILINALDFTFPLVIQLVRFPLFTARILGDAVVMVVKAIASALPVAAQTRKDWQASIGDKWLWLRARISYRAFEQAVHHLFEDGMAWVFRRCRKLSPRQALCVITGAALWLPVSFGIATVMHVSLLAYAAVLPAWMQLLHPMATFIAKSKLLILPVYPAAWPQAKQHPFVRSVAKVYERVRRFYLIRKTAYRYRQTEAGRQAVSNATAHACARVGITQFSEKVWDWTILVLAWPVMAFHWSLRLAFSCFSNMLFIGPVLRSYAASYAALEERNAKRTSEKVSGLFAEWSIKFSAEYYEAKEREAARTHAEPLVPGLRPARVETAAVDDAVRSAR